MTTQDACDILNDLLALDPALLYQWVCTTFITNDSVAQHPTIQVRQAPIPYPDGSPIWFASCLGLLNGFLGKAGDRAAVAYYDEPDEKTGICKLLEFRPATDEQMTQWTTDLPEVETK